MVFSWPAKRSVAANFSTLNSETVFINIYDPKHAYIDYIASMYSWAIHAQKQYNSVLTLQLLLIQKNIKYIVSIYWLGNLHNIKRKMNITETL